jgi:hypothetical protein
MPSQYLVIALTAAFSLLIVGLVVVNMNVASAQGGCLPQKTGPCKPYDSGDNNVTRSIGGSTTTSSGSGGLHK